MNLPLESSFIFTVCQVGAEKALKAEVSREHPDLRFAFSRPGFVTFKSQNGPLQEDFELKSIFARAYGLSLGKKAAQASEVLELARSIREGRGRPLRLHVFERDQFAPGEAPLGHVPGNWEAHALQEIRALAPADFFLSEEEASLEDPVLDVICVEEGEWWLGFHRQTPWHAPVPGGKWKITLPGEAPSRAYLKLEEALHWSRAPVRGGDQAVEIGSAPGGASYALLKRGVNVVGIDPGEMAPSVLRFPGPARYEHIGRSVATVLREELPDSVQWLLVDMNTGPDTALFSVDRLGFRMRDSLLGVILTLKLNEWSFAQHIPAWLEQIRKIGISRVRATQLSHNRREICVVGLTSKGMMRLREAK